MRRSVILALTLVLAAPAFAEDVELVTGEVLKGKVSERSQAGLRIDHPVLGRLWISGENVVAVDGGPLVDPMSAAVTDLAAATPGAEAAKKTEPEVDPAEQWKFNFDFGASGKNGNGNNNDLNAAIQAKQEDAEKRWLFRGEYYYSDTDDQKTKDKTSIVGVRDFLLPDSPWFLFGAAKYEWDSFSSWNRRLTTSAGVGRDIYKDESWDVRGRAGFGYTKEYGSDNDDWRPEGMIGAEARWKINGWQSIEANSYYFPDFDQSSEYRLTSRLEWSVQLNEAKSLFLKVGFLNEYDTHRKRPFDRNELQYTVALSYAF